VSGDRHSHAEDAFLLTDQDEIARREAENGLRQFALALEMIRNHVKDRERPFKLRAGYIIQLHKLALEGIHRLAGTYRNRLRLVAAVISRPIRRSLQTKSKTSART
jgi:hypothetical protein